MILAYRLSCYHNHTAIPPFITYSFPSAWNESLPIAVPLRLGESEPAVDLQPLLHRVYDRARFELAIDLKQPPKPMLSNDDWQWLQAIANKHSRS